MSRSARRSAWSAPLWWVALLLGLLTAAGARAQDEIPELSAPVQSTPKTIVRVDVVFEGGRWRRPVKLRVVKAGELLTGDIARRAMDELLRTGRYASVRVEEVPAGNGVVMRLVVVPRKIVRAVRVRGGELDEDGTLRAAGLRADAEITVPMIATMQARIRAYYAERGYPKSRVAISTIETEDPLRVVVNVSIVAGTPLVVHAIAARTGRKRTERLNAALSTYEVSVGDRVDEELFGEADAALAKELRSRGWHRARVRHRTSGGGDGVRLVVIPELGPRIRIRFEGNSHFDRSRLLDALELADNEDRSQGGLVRRIRKFYVQRGFLDVAVTADEIGDADDPVHDLRFKIKEGHGVRVTARFFPCLTGARTADDVGSEIDGILSEELPGGELIGDVNPSVIDGALGPRGRTGSRPVPYRLNPWSTYVPDVYERAMKHVQDLYRSEGYLSAEVGPAVLVRRRCSVLSPAGKCIPVGARKHPKTACRYDRRGLPLPESEPDPTASCVPDPRRGVRCEPEVALHIPVKLGPRTTLYDIKFEGNRRLVERQLFDVAQLDLGRPVSQIEVEKAQQRVLRAYADEGFAFARVDVRLDLSPDRSRGRASFAITEGERVIVSDILVKGARRTSERLILRRVALVKGEPFRRSQVRQTEEQLATLGVFASVSVSLEDPQIPAKEKVVIISVQERIPQRIEPRVGLSTGEGFRVGLEYGHRNLGGSAIQLTTRLQLAYLPDVFIFEEALRRKFNRLSLGDRLERRITASVEFPEIGLGPLFRLSVDGVAVHDIARDFRITKNAGIVTLLYRPNREFSVPLGASVELNDAQLNFEDSARDSFVAFLRVNPIPEGESVVISQRTGFTWDRRDEPLGATSGTFVSAGVEHARAIPIGDTQEQVSDFLKFSNRMAGYLRLTDGGTALAVSVRWGFVQHLIADRQTYPDRLFFFGGVDSMRGFLQSSVVPEDVAQELLSETPESTANASGPCSAWIRRISPATRSSARSQSIGRKPPGAVGSRSSGSSSRSGCSFCR